MSPLPNTMLLLSGASPFLFLSDTPIWIIFLYAMIIFMQQLPNMYVHPRSLSWVPVAYSLIPLGRLTSKHVQMELSPSPTSCQLAPPPVFSYTINGFTILFSVIMARNFWIILDISINYSQITTTLLQILTTNSINLSLALTDSASLYRPWVTAKVWH